MERIKNFFVGIARAIVTRGPIGWCRRLHSVVQTYHYNMSIIGSSVDEVGNIAKEVERYVKRATKVHVDITAQADNANTVIVCGTYRGKDYVRVFPVQHAHMDETVNWLEGVSRHATIGKLDMPPAFDATVRRELKDRGIA